MRSSLSAGRNILIGLVVAIGISFSFTELSASMDFGCSGSASCGENPISCECKGSGECVGDEQAGLAICECDGFDTVSCTCENGCS